ncbi:Uma2 family endonuclease [Thermosynechococcus sp. GLH187]|uniref:Uma2 family endonuclease n=1 Tax=unclassified Thermosynechococcus TaxID=2622553 RepID=UPI002877E3EE|nr:MULTISPECIES: Uma2 family endonuclease [unclassified Thermosynechococcus]WNC44345.1 Uma2 family endonuclease [Thermosynechococcus sp. GLH187]WNC46881.1 Uma2 family endonuclease [Thermosynechococcus sp. GLH333]WNC49418.1 Uma2 family endonuclease [Thermosynechococcus sp. GLH87]WNC59567.1 Uma2 family endonuclease [Thermosynechococcus sp. QS41]
MRGCSAMLTIALQPVLELTDEQFAAICRQNPDLRLERSPRGELIIMPPTGGETGRRHLQIAVQLYLWNQQSRLGVAFDSSTGFKLPNGAIRSPDVAWIRGDRWHALTPEQRQGFVPLCPDFVIELRAASDDLRPLEAKMREYLDNGLHLGWLIDPQNQRVEIYRSQMPPEVAIAPRHLFGEDLLPGFVLDLTEILP